MVLKPRTLINDQYEWYRSQPVTYRRDWWVWASDQPNFDSMVVAFVEDDPSVIRMRNLMIEQRGGK